MTEPMTLSVPKPAIGVLCIGDLCFNLHYYPNAFHRLMQRIVFGFVWRKA